MAREKLRASLQSLEALAAHAGVPIRYETFKLLRGKERDSSSLARGGLVRLGPRKFVLCESSLPVIDKIAVIAEALASIGIDVLDLPPLLRARIHKRPARPPRQRLVLKPMVKTSGSGIPD